MGESESSPPLGSGGTAPAESGFVHNGWRSNVMAGPPLFLSSTAGVAWASDGTAPDADGLGAHLARPGQEYLCRSRVDRAGRKQPHAARNRAPRGAYYCGRCAVCRQQAGRIGSDGRHHAEGTGTGTGVRPPSSLICWPDRSVPNSSTHLLKKKKKTQARTHARTPPADAAVAWAFGARAAIASCVARAAGVWVVHVDGI